MRIQGRGRGGVPVVAMTRCRRNLQPWWELRAWSLGVIVESGPCVFSIELGFVYGEDSYSRPIMPRHWFDFGVERLAIGHTLKRI